MTKIDYDRQRVGQYLQSIREKHNVSQRALAGRLEINHSVITRVESGKDGPSDRVLYGYAQEFREIDVKSVKEGFGVRRRTTVRTKTAAEVCMIDREASLTIARNGSCTGFDMRLGITPLVRGLEEVPLGTFSNVAYDAANFRDIRGGWLDKRADHSKPQTHVAAYLRFIRPLNQWEKHDISYTFDLAQSQRRWLISPSPSLPHRPLALSVWLPDNPGEDVQLYSVDGYQIEEGSTPRFDDAACSRVSQ